MKTFGQPGLHLMGFKPLDRLKLHYNVKNTKFMRPDETKIVGSTLMFNALLDRLAAKQQFAVCRLVCRYARRATRARTEPTLNPPFTWT